MNGGDKASNDSSTPAAAVEAVTAPLQIGERLSKKRICCHWFYFTAKLFEGGAEKFQSVLRKLRSA